MTTDECPFCYQSVPLVNGFFELHYPLSGPKATPCLGSGVDAQQLGISGELRD